MKVRTRPIRRLFRRLPDERLATLADLAARCCQIRHASRHYWQRPSRISITDDLQLIVNDETSLSLLDWSFGQLCRLAGLNKQTMNRLTRRMASEILQRMMPQTDRPWEIQACCQRVRDIHGLSYSRLWNGEVVSVLREFSSIWQPLPQSRDASCGLFYGEQDMFCFLIDPAGWVEIDSAAFAPGIVAWNSEVGRRPLGIQAFWYQAANDNHVLWDPVWKRRFLRRHSGHVRQGLEQTRRMLEALCRRRDERRDAFVRVLRKAQRLRLARRADEACNLIREVGIPQRLACAAIENAQCTGRLTILAIVQSLTRLSQGAGFHWPANGAGCQGGQATVACRLELVPDAASPALAASALHPASFR